MFHFTEMRNGHIDAICRRGARLRTEGLPPPGEMRPETVAVWLGAPRFRDAPIAGRARRPGVAVGLAATATGGEVQVVEAACLPGHGQLRVTGAAGTSVKPPRRRRSYEPVPDDRALSAPKPAASSPVAASMTSHVTPTRKNPSTISICFRVSPSARPRPPSRDRERR